MTDEKKKDGAQKRISEKQRFTYIGFEVFPGKPKDLFKSDAERKKYIDLAEEKRSKGETIRETCTLMEERISFVDRLVLTISCVVMFAALFLPWYSVHNEIIEEVQAATNEVVADSTALMTDSTMLAQAGTSPDSLSDSTVQLAASDEGSSESETGPASEAQEPIDIAAEGSETIVAATGTENDEVETGRIRTTANEEIIHGYVARKKIHREFSRLSGLGSIFSLGSVGSYLFSSGGVLILTTIIFLLYTLACLGLPAYTLYGLYGTKGDDDNRALQLKKIVRFNWIPLLLFLFAFILSFVGSDYGFDPTTMFTSIGRDYGPGVFLGSLSWGVFIAMGASILLAVKGSEI